MSHVKSLSVSPYESESREISPASALAMMSTVYLCRNLDATKAISLYRNEQGYITRSV